MIEINSLIAWLKERANKSTTWYERTAYLETIKHIEELKK